MATWLLSGAVCRAAFASTTAIALSLLAEMPSGSALPIEDAMPNGAAPYGEMPQDPGIQAEVVKVPAPWRRGDSRRQ
ncbi:hypothetical protein [Puniceibacterium sediminis]|uniref:hypothetical protein n=1 Tax=Puniceibacterium sediminis TaxID=1608407 RepID=UPI000B78E2AA|nr:hypothetical protein [Puniceibacterium sediminis]